MRVEPNWIDYNGHLNMAYYNVVFDRAVDELWEALGIGPEYRSSKQCSLFSAECHVRYLREITPGASLQVSVLLVGADQKRLHSFRQLSHASEGWLSATSENMSLHVDMKTKKVSSFPPDIYARIQDLFEQHSHIERPDGLGRQISMQSLGGTR
jgi:acyl-CoA thioester hydrolase